MIGHLENLENDMSGREYESLLGDYQWMGVSQYKGYLPRIHAEIETILNKIQEHLNAHDNCLTGDGVKTV